jgi:DNA (cytosine-5)-methyltransferase 1
MENVPGLLSSHAGKDLGALLGILGELRYGWAFRVLDAQWFGVPQRRRRVFILALDLERHPDDGSAAEVLAVGSRCGRDHQAEREAWAGAAGRAGRGAIGTLREHVRPGSNTDHTVLVDGSEAHADRGGAPDGLAGWVDGRGRVAETLNSGGNSGGFRTEPGAHLVVANAISASAGHHGHGSPRGDGGDNLVYVKASRYGEHGDPRRPDGNEAETWKDGIVSASLDAIGHTPRTATAVIRPTIGDRTVIRDEDGSFVAVVDPEGLDSHRYRCAGNGVVAPVAEWIGWRLRRFLEGSL